MANMSFGVNLLPKTNNTYSLGNSDYKWANIFTNKINGTDIEEIISGSGSGSGESSSSTVEDIQINSSSILNNGVANIPYASGVTAGVIKIGAGLTIDSDGTARINKALDNLIKAGNNEFQPITPSKQHVSVFYGLARAAGDSTQSASNNTVGTYTDEAKTAIQSMLGITNYSEATSSAAGLMSATDKIKLNEIDEKAPAVLDIKTAYNHTNVSEFTFIGNSHAWGTAKYANKKNLIKFIDKSGSYGNNTITVSSYDNIVVINGTTESGSNDLSWLVDENVDLPAGSYTFTISPYVGNSTLNNGKNMHLDLWYDNNTSTTHDKRVTLSGVKSTENTSTFTITDHVWKIRVWVGYTSNTYNDYRLFYSLFPSDVTIVDTQETLAETDTLDIALPSQYSVIDTLQHQSSASTIVDTKTYIDNHTQAIDSLLNDKADKTVLLDAGITASTYSTAFGGAFTVTTATDNNHIIPYAKATPTGVINKHKRYRVTINDIEYILESRIWFLEDKFYNYLGDISKVYEHPEYVPGGTDSDVPFLITFDRDSNSSIEVYTTTAGTYTIKIETITDTFKKLPLELIYGSAYAPILQSDNTGSTFNGYSIGVNILQNKRGTIAVGYGNDLREEFSIAIGGNNIVSSGYTTVLGDNNTIQSNYGYVFGMNNIIYNSESPVSVLGFQNTIYSKCATSIAIGYKNIIYANSHRAYAVGYWNLNYGDYSNTFGYSNCAFSDYTTAIGFATLANSKYQITLGTYNVIDTTTAWVSGTSYVVGDKVYINERWYECKTANTDTNFTEDHWTRCRGHFVEILGNGNLDASSTTRSNARATDWDGNTYIKGNLYIGCNADSSGGTRVPHDIQINGTSIVSNGIADIPIATTEALGIVKSGGMGVNINSSGQLYISAATSAHIKAGTQAWTPITPNRQHEAAFYGLAKAAGDSTQSASSNTVGTYTDNAKTAIKNMLGIPMTADDMPMSSSDATTAKAAIDTLNSKMTQTIEIANSNFSLDASNRYRFVDTDNYVPSGATRIGFTAMALNGGYVTVGGNGKEMRVIVTTHDGTNVNGDTSYQIKGLLFVKY